MAAQSGALRKTTRKDGLVIITKHLPDTKRFRISIGAKVGSAYDPPDKDGLHHFFEHMAFKGTKNRSGLELRALMNRYSHHHNAYTARLETVYQLEGISRHRDIICDLAFDIYQNSIFPVDELIKEKEVVENEITRDHDQNDYVVDFELWKLLWQKNPLRKFGVGTYEGIQCVSRDDLLNVHSQSYKPHNTFIVASGDVDHDILVTRIKSWIPLDDQAPGPSNVCTWDDEWQVPPVQKEHVLLKPGAKNAHVAVGLKIPNRNSFTEREGLVLIVLVNMLNEMLFQEVREKRGYAYTIGAGLGGDFELGHYLQFSGEMLPNRVHEVRSVMHEVIHELPLGPVSFSDNRESLRDKLPNNGITLLLNKISSVERTLRMSVVSSPEKMRCWPNSHLKKYQK